MNYEEGSFSKTTDVVETEKEVIKKEEKIKKIHLIFNKIKHIFLLIISYIYQALRFLIKSDFSKKIRQYTLKRISFYPFFICFITLLILFIFYLSEKNINIKVYAFIIVLIVFMSMFLLIYLVSLIKKEEYHNLTILLFLVNVILGCISINEINVLKKDNSYDGYKNSEKIFFKIKNDYYDSGYPYKLLKLRKTNNSKEIVLNEELLNSYKVVRIEAGIVPNIEKIVLPWIGIFNHENYKDYHENGHFLNIFKRESMEYNPEGLSSTQYVHDGIIHSRSMLGVELRKWMYYYYLPQNLKTVVLTNETTITANGFYNVRTIEKLGLSKDISYIGKKAFLGCTNLKDVYYEGTKEEWEKVQIIEEDNDVLLNATMHFNFDIESL